MPELIRLSPFDLMLAGLFVASAGLVSLLLHIGVGKRLTIAAIRTVIQLLMVGLVLQWVFTLRVWWIVVAVFASMVINAGVAAVQRTELRFAGIWSSGLLSVGLSATLVTFTVTEVVIGIDPWYAPQYLIPLLGMVLGNSLTGITLCLDRLTNDLRQRRPEVELWLACGASIWEATRPILADAVRTGMLPTLNAMSVAGIVSLPGMMTGQILGGSPPMEAVKYQIMVMFMVAGASSLGALFVSLLAYRKLVTADHQLAIHRITGAND